MSISEEISLSIVDSPEELRAGCALRFERNGLHVVWEVAEDGDLRLLHFSCLPLEPSLLRAGKEHWFRAVELQATGRNQKDHHGLKRTGTSPAREMIFEAARSSRAEHGDRLEFDLIHADGLRVCLHWQFYDGLPVARCWVSVENGGREPVSLEHLSSFHLVGIEKEASRDWAESLRVHIGHNCWKNESQWRAYSLPDLGFYSDEESGFSTKRVAISGLGGWSNGEYLSMGAVENLASGTTLSWDVEHFGSWGYEIGTIAHHLYIQAHGPSYNDHHWRKSLQPGETFQSVPVAVACVEGGLDEAGRVHNALRRRIRRPNADNRELPVVFNDYMNCLMGDPTTDKLLPLIDGAAEVGCEIFVIDAGWYDDGPWWDGVGQWQPSPRRFPGGIEELLQRIRDRGMVPGLWLEIESMGIACPLAAQWPDECFFLRDGRRIVSNSRYHLDFRHPVVRSHADDVIDRIVGQYGAGYIKMDFNINLGPGTDVAADSEGDGFLQHNRAYLAWLEEVWRRHSDLIIENCGSGGLRMNAALLRHHSIQSTSDCQDYRKYAAIAAACPLIAPPEQLAVWSYPEIDGSEEEAAFNMVNALLLRIHQSGHIGEFSAARLDLVREGIALHKRLRPYLREARPFWPLGIPRIGDSWIALGMDCGEHAWLALWRDGAATDHILLDTAQVPGEISAPRIVYPVDLPGSIGEEGAGRWRVVMPEPVSARLIQLRGDDPAR